ncbi:MAG: PorP/SprF family type IX secretion system membrane protein, partial [Bacteroidia bacterium]
MTTKSIKLIAVSSVIAFSMNAQDIHFSQFNEAPLLVNPANTGLFDGYSRANLNYRNQWSSAGSPFKTMAASFDSEIGLKKNKGAFLGLGGFVFQDKAGAANWSRFNFDMFVNGIVKVGKASHLAAAIGGGYVQNSADFNKLTFGNQYNGDSFSTDLPSQETIVFRKYNYADVAAGLNFEFDKALIGFDRNTLYAFKIGVAAYHLNRPHMQYATSSKERMDPRYVANMSARFDFKGTKLSFVPSAIYQMQGQASELNAGGFLKMRFIDQTKITGTKHESSVYIGLFT